ncbi:MAG: hypothetical protein MUC49_02415 [Raineya sp.]|nr:hypothetical protein [Raineya sp.]
MKKSILLSFLMILTMLCYGQRSEKSFQGMVGRNFGSVVGMEITKDNVAETVFSGIYETKGSGSLPATGKMLKSNNRFGMTVWSQDKSTVLMYFNGYMNKATLTITGQVTDSNNKYVCEFSFKSVKN